MNWIKKIVSTLILGIALPFMAIGQSGGEKVRAAKITYIADRLDLTSDQSKSFWGIYNQYEDQMRTLRRLYRAEYQKKGGDVNNKSATAQYINSHKDFLKKRESLRRVYQVKLLRIITNQQYQQLLKAEDDFRDMLLQKLKDKGKFE